MEDTDEIAALREELKVLRDQMFAMNRLFSVGQLAAGVIHEINSPIASIFSNLDVLEKSVEALERENSASSSAKSKRLTETMRTLLSVDRVACERIKSIIRSLKTHARTDDEEFRQVELSVLLDDSLRLIQSNIRDRIEIEKEYSPIPPVATVPHLLAQAFLNILVNAVQAIEDRGKVTVRLHADNDFVVVEIADTGVGISPDCKSRILAGGFTTKPLGIGTGLGLAISRQIVVDRHGGSLDFESEPGKGTTFIIRIPLRRGPAKEAQ